MTLNTAVYVLSEADPHDVFWKCRDLLDAPADLPFVDERAGRGGADWHLRNPGGVGLSAWLWIYYVPNAMRRPTDDHDEDCEDDCTGSWHDPPHWFKVTFDTAYGYHDEEGRTCGVLHASLVAQLGQWLDDRDLRWAWRNEFTGEVHIGDRYERLYDLFKGGDDANRWFETIVKPAIAFSPAAPDPERRAGRHEAVGLLRSLTVRVARRRPLVRDPESRDA